MKQLKIAVYAICKNEEKHIARWVQSMQEADGIFVADTGSEDSSVSLLKEYGVTVNRIRLEDWRFDTARNMSLALVPKDYDICVCTDLDEVFEEGWRKEIESVWVKGKTTRLRYPYIWSFNEDGSPAVSFYLDKIHARQGYQWVHPVHEVLKYSGTQQYATAENILLKHYPDMNKSRAQYLPLLEQSVRENPQDDRNMHYLGREYMYYGEYEKCIETLKRHLLLKSANWLDERAASMRYIARSYDYLGDRQSASDWYYRAIAEAPFLREGYVESALLAFKEKNWPKVYHMCDEALKILEKPKSYINEGFCWDGTVYDISSIAAYFMGMKDKAVQYAKEALFAQPNNERIKNNLHIFESK